MVLSAFWRLRVSGHASGCQKSCKWFASGDFNNHLQKNYPLKIVVLGREISMFAFSEF